MIYDRLDNIDMYKNISKWMDSVIDFIKNHKLEDLPLGKTIIYDSHSYINVMEVETKTEQQVNYEIHKKYMDIQICLHGEERILIGTGTPIPVNPFDPSIDFGTVDCNNYINCRMHPGYFIICMNDEPHKPTIEVQGCSMVKKCVIKVEVDEYE